MTIYPTSMCSCNLERRIIENPLVPYGFVSSLLSTGETRDVNFMSKMRLHLGLSESDKKSERVPISVTT